MPYVKVLLPFWMMCCCFNSILIAQTPNARLLQTADSLARVHQTAEALHEYKRWLFFNADYSRTNEVLFRMAKLYENQGSYREAVILYKRIAGTDASPAVQSEAVYRSVLAQFLSGQSAEAVTDTEPYTTASLQDTSIRKLRFVRLLCLNEVRRLDDALREAKQLFPANAHPALDSVYGVAQKALSTEKSEDKAQWLSLIPGAGQWYVGQKKDATVSFLMTGAFAAGTLTAVWYRHYLLAGLGILPLGQRFYSGGRDYAKKSAQEYNKALYADVARMLNGFLLELKSREL